MPSLPESHETSLQAEKHRLADTCFQRSGCLRHKVEQHTCSSLSLKERIERRKARGNKLRRSAQSSLGDQAVQSMIETRRGRLFPSLGIARPAGDSFIVQP